jgi:hypothetical protein
MGIYTTFRHYAPLFPTKREKGQRKKEEKRKSHVDFSSHDWNSTTQANEMSAPENLQKKTG